MASAYDLHTRALTPVTELPRPDGGGVLLVEGGRADFHLEYDARDERSREAAEVLSTVFEKTCGVRPPETGGRYRVSFTEPWRGSNGWFSVKTTAAGLEIAGEPLYAAVDIAERLLGVRWYYPGRDGEIFPKHDRFEIVPVHYEDRPYFRKRRPGSACLASLMPGKHGLADYWENYLGALTPEDRRFAMRYMRTGGKAPAATHSPRRPELLAKAYPDRLETLFYRTPHGKLLHNPGGHAGNYYNVFSLEFADFLVELAKKYYASGGKDNPGQLFADDEYVCFGVTDSTILHHQDVIGDPLLEKYPDLVGEKDIARGDGGFLANVYARFYAYLGGRLKKELNRKLFCLLYYNSALAPLNPNWRIGGDVDGIVCCDGMLQRVMDPKQFAVMKRKFADWYDAFGGRPASMAWFYAPRFFKPGRAIAPEFVGYSVKALGPYLGRTGILYDYDLGQKDVWHYFWAAYACFKCQWNPDFDVEAALAEMWPLLFGAEAGEKLSAFHRVLKDAFVKYFATVSNEAEVAYPLSVVDELERLLAEAGRAIPRGGVEERRFRLVADYWKEPLQRERQRIAYRVPEYVVTRTDGGAPDWTKVPAMPLRDCRGGTNAVPDCAVRLAWNGSELLGRFEAAYAPKLNRAETRIFGGDCVEVFLSPTLEKAENHQFVFGANGGVRSQKQIFRPVPAPPDTTWTCRGLDWKPTVAEKGWSGEFRIPLASLRPEGVKANDRWNANIVVNRLSPPASTGGTSLTLGDHHNLSMYGILSFAGRRATAFPAASDTPTAGVTVTGVKSPGKVSIVGEDAVYTLSHLMRELGGIRYRRHRFGLSVCDGRRDGFSNLLEAFLLTVNGLCLSELQEEDVTIRRFGDGESAGVEYLLSFDGVPVVLRFTMKPGSQLLHGRVIIAPGNEWSFRVSAVPSGLDRGKKNVLDGYDREIVTAQRVLKGRTGDHAVRREDGQFLFRDAVMDGSSAEKGWGPIWFRPDFGPVESGSWMAESKWCAYVDLKMKKDAETFDFDLWQNIQKRVSNREAEEMFR